MLVESVVEIPTGASNKYEMGENGRIKLCRVLYSPVRYPAEYGYIRYTHGGDGDPLDILILISQPTFPGCIVPTRIVGALEMVDEEGIDTKVLGVCDVDPRYDHIRKLEDVPPHFLKEVRHFFDVYTELEGRDPKLGEWRDYDDACKKVMDAQSHYYFLKDEGDNLERFQ